MLTQGMKNRSGLVLKSRLHFVSVCQSMATRPGLNQGQGSEVKAPPCQTLGLPYRAWRCRRDPLSLHTAEATGLSRNHCGWSPFRWSDPTSCFVSLTSDMRTFLHGLLICLHFYAGDKSDCVCRKLNAPLVCRSTRPAEEFSQTARIVQEWERGREWGGKERKTGQRIDSQWVTGGEWWWCDSNTHWSNGDRRLKVALVLVRNQTSHRIHKLHV